MRVVSWVTAPWGTSMVVVTEMAPWVPVYARVPAVVAPTVTLSSPEPKQTMGTEADTTVVTSLLVRVAVLVMPRPPAMPVFTVTGMVTVTRPPAPTVRLLDRMGGVPGVPAAPGSRVTGPANARPPGRSS